MAAANSFFDQLSSILKTDKYWLSDDNKKEYNPVGVNVGLSQHPDTILYVNEMNQLWQHVSQKMHYDFYFYAIRKMNRTYKKWAKKTKDEDVELVSKYYQVSRLKAEDMCSILTPDQIEIIREELSYDD